MSFLIGCPHCGARPQPEFSYGGTAGEAYEPAMLDALSEDLYFDDNVAGEQLERWYHRYGCERWLLVRRDTRTNEVTEVWDGVIAP